MLLYCTGGIRCEKASAYLKHEGFTNVGQLHGGIIDYARQIKARRAEEQIPRARTSCSMSGWPSASPMMW
jgi:hypothetical protein